LRKRGVNQAMSEQTDCLTIDGREVREPADLLHLLEAATRSENQYVLLLAKELAERVRTLGLRAYPRLVRPPEAPGSRSTTPTDGIPGAAITLLSIAWALSFQPEITTGQEGQVARGLSALEYLYQSALTRDLQANLRRLQTRQRMVGYRRRKRA